MRFRMLFALALMAVPMSLAIAAQASAPCVADFTAFIARFEADTAFQRGNTQYPLAYSFIEKAPDEKPRTVSLALSRAQALKYAGLDFPSADRQASIPLLRGLKCGTANACVVSFDRQGSDSDSLRFSFGVRKGCWRLVGVADASL